MEKNYRDNKRGNAPEVLTSCVHVNFLGRKQTDKQTNPEIKYQNAVTRTLPRNFHVSPHTTVVIT